MADLTINEVAGQHVHGQCQITRRILQQLEGCNERKTALSLLVIVYYEMVHTKQSTTTNTVQIKHSKG